MRSILSRSYLKGLTVAAVLGLTLNACSRGNRDDDDDGQGADAGKAEMVRYNVNLAQVQMRLAGASAYSIAVEGCVSGYTSTVTDASPSLAVYKFDKGCLAKLNSLTVDGVVYTPSTTAPFKTWAEGDTAWFNGTLGSGKKLLLQVIHQLDNPIPSTAPTHGVEYAFSTIDAGDNKTCADDCVKNSYTVAVKGVAAPSFDIRSFSYIDLTSTGAGVFSFGFECSEDIVGSGVSATCKGTPLSGLRYRLVQDTFNGTLNVEQASGIISANPSMVDASEVIAAGVDPAMPHGGFRSKPLAGPSQMHLNPEMLIVLESLQTSYKYWNVDVTPIIQP